MIKKLIIVLILFLISSKQSFGQPFIVGSITYDYMKYSGSQNSSNSHYYFNYQSSDPSILLDSTNSGSFGFGLTMSIPVSQKILIDIGLNYFKTETNIKLGYGYYPEWEFIYSYPIKSDILYLPIGIKYCLDTKINKERFGYVVAGFNIRLFENKSKDYVVYSQISNNGSPSNKYLQTRYSPPLDIKSNGVPFYLGFGVFVNRLNVELRYNNSLIGFSDPNKQTDVFSGYGTSYHISVGFKILDFSKEKPL